MFDEFKEEFLKFDRIAEKLAGRADLHAFILLEKLLPGQCDMVASAQHDEIYLEPSPKALLEVATKEQIRDLHRCGVRYDKEYDSLCMFV